MGLSGCHRCIVAGGRNGVLVRGEGTNWTVQSPSGDSVQAFVTCVAADHERFRLDWGRARCALHWAGGQFKDLGLQASLPKSHRAHCWRRAMAISGLERIRRMSYTACAGKNCRRSTCRPATGSSGRWRDAAGNFWAGRRTVCCARDG